jgi:hypothetical protein
MVIAVREARMVAMAVKAVESTTPEHYCLVTAQSVGTILAVVAVEENNRVRIQATAETVEMAVVYTTRAH